MRNTMMLTALLFAFGCATNDATPGSDPEITLIQLSRVAEGTQYDTGPITAQFAVEVKNTLTEPLRLSRVGLQSIGGGAYTLAPYSQAFNETILPGETRRVSFFAPAYVAIPTVGSANGPVTLRGTLDFDTGGKKFQKIVVQNIGATGGG